MNNTQQAKNGFRTFVVTFMISIFVFGIFYYLISDVSTENLNIEASGELMGSSKETPSTPATSGDVAGLNTSTADDAVVPEPVIEEVATNTQARSTFSGLASAKMDVASRTVLAGATESTQSTTPVPDTGDFSITFGIVSSVALFAFFGYVVIMNPRKYALAKFERDMTE